jgi:hypothetical protein
MGKACRIGGLWEMLDRNEERLKNWVFQEQMFKRWENNPETVAQVTKYAEMLKKRVG